ncbi:MAG TPA: nodulation protein NfeD [Anaerolineaceae bacterium]|nr:nodulation protein NfeD [Longilinea sp.]HNR47522.1 nodulation protein NfeD [Anaerolineaceae bacterium]HOG78295.1 nodulation protein NfeD [Anaerolineaceae bacterium]HQF62426.1 nodulation protein NfeD [Anaerolineaceae bacterium]HQH85635.1 nodulation protein NfeD [Anaerolineaceae bacterium]
MKRFLGVCWLILLIAGLLTTVAQAQSQGGTALVLTAEGPLTPVLVQYLDRGLGVAQSQGAELVILQLNTPGGSTDLMNQMVTLIRNSDIPVVVYVTPNGAMAGSAGTIITLSAHAAYMAPETIIGAASPVDSEGGDLGETMDAKIKNVLSAQVRSYAERRGPAAVALAEDTIQNARAAAASEALEVGLIDGIAVDLPDLLNQLDGQVVLVNGANQTLNTRDLTPKALEQTFIEELLQLLTNPNLVFLLLSIGVQAVLIELSSPGGWVAGFIGAVCLALAIYGLGILPVNWFGLIFLVIAFVLFILDLKAPTHGALTVAGVGSFIAGALVLFNSVRIPGVPRISVPLVVGTGIFIAVTFSFAVGLALKAMRAPSIMGKETLVGKRGVVRVAIAPRGQVRLGGENWVAELPEGETTPILPGQTVEVIAVEGLRLKVRPEK